MLGQRPEASTTRAPNPIAAHPLADIFPLIEGAEFDELVADVRVHGVHEPVVLFEGKIPDGRNRYRAATAAGVDCPTRAYDGSDPVGFVVSLNLKRRHLSESQRAMVAARLATLRLGDNQHSEGLPIGRGSELLNVGERTVARAREVQEHGAPELVRAVERGEVSVSAASDIASQPIEEQREIVARGEREILRAAEEIRARKAEIRRTERIERLCRVSEGNAPLPTERRYPLVYADPPWKFFAFNENSGFSGQAADHYPSLSIEEICALPVSALATDGAVLFLWAVNAELPGALKVIEAWGFEYKTCIAWVKDRAGLGHYVRNQHELLLIATRGDIPPPTASSRPSSVIEAPRREHSRKPDEAYELIECMYPDLPRIELFARHSRPGWDSWGNEAPACSEAAS